MDRRVYAGGCREFAVNCGDEIFATAVQLGRTVYNAVFTGVKSVNELLVSLTGELANFTGLVTVNLRNRTQGTVTKRVLRLGGSRRVRYPEATQLSLSF
ncbi:MAG: hypothetical protein K2O10_01090 [Muribaculaceae bacterium]|nr:hypothetical protein [Muribaculaceae bacterium]